MEQIEVAIEKALREITTALYDIGNELKAIKRELETSRKERRSYH